MPRFVDLQEVKVEMDITVSNYYRIMTPNERKQMANLLKSNIGSSVFEHEFEKSLIKLSENYHSLTAEECETINKIANRL